MNELISTCLVWGPDRTNMKDLLCILNAAAIPMVAHEDNILELLAVQTTALRPVNPTPAPGPEIKAHVQLHLPKGLKT